MNKVILIVLIIVSIIVLSFILIVILKMFSHRSFRDLIWSRGYDDLVIKNNPNFPKEYYSYSTEYVVSDDFMNNIDFSNLKKVLWLRTGSKFGEENDVSKFERIGLRKLRYPIILITSDGDCSIPKDLKSDIVGKNILENPYIIKWYTQNYDGECIHPKLIALPIGLDLHTDKTLWRYLGKLINDEKVNAILNNYKNTNNWENRKNILFADLKSKSHPERKDLEDLINKNKDKNSHIELLKDRLTFDQMLRKYSEYKYVVSPRGNGLDCHRTYEALLMGCVVITKSIGGIDNIFQQNNLPVIILKDWNEILDINNMNKWENQIKKYIPNTSFEAYNRMKRDNFLKIATQHLRNIKINE
jgi:hypothetical protein